LIDCLLIDPSLCQGPVAEMKSVLFLSELVTYELLIDCLLIDPSICQGPASKMKSVLFLSELVT
jgi:hypothetical protein